MVHQISLLAQLVTTQEDPVSFLLISRSIVDSFFDVGLTPLHAAIAGKQWNTAKLIMGIAGAQYHDDNDDDQEEKWRASLFDLGMSLLK